MAYKWSVPAFQKAKTVAWWTMTFPRYPGSQVITAEAFSWGGVVEVRSTNCRQIYGGTGDPNPYQRWTVEIATGDVDVEFAIVGLDIFSI